MLEIILVTIVLGLLSGASLIIGILFFSKDLDIIGIPFIGLATVLLACALVTPLIGIDSARKVAYYNQKLHTNYTLEQFMRNGDEIERVEIPQLIKIQKDAEK